MGKKKENLGRLKIAAATKISQGSAGQVKRDNLKSQNAYRAAIGLPILME